MMLDEPPFRGGFLVLFTFLFAYVIYLLYIAPMKNNTVVYIHRKKTDDTIFYVGIGKPSRPYIDKGRSSLWNRDC